MVMRPCHYPVASLLPHRPPMILIDEVVGYDDNALIAAVNITEASLFLTPEGVPGHVGIEYMAQACGAYAGVQALASGEPVRIGLLLGTRDYRIAEPWFRRGDRLLITATMVFRDDPVAAFDCTIAIDDRVRAEAQLKVYQGDEDQLMLATGVRARDIAK